MSKSELADYTYTVKEGQPSRSGADDAPVWIMCEPRTKELSIVGDKGFLSLHLRAGTTYAEAQEIARYLKERVTDIGFTSF